MIGLKGEMNMKKFEAPEMELVMISLEVSMLNISYGDPANNSSNDIIWGNP